ncbi:MAG: ABC transporter permease, partial [Eubacteriales bacterium]|nr:ABC transporter permease [Eubacteriales bacterium]
LIKEDIIGLYIIKEGFSQAIKTGKTQRIIEVRYLADNYTAPGITDLITPHFLLDILKQQTVLTVNRSAFSDNPELGDTFRDRFLEYTILYEDSEELELQVILNSINSEAVKPLFSTSKEIIIRYFLSVVLIFLIITGFYQAIQVNIDKEHGIIGRIKLSQCPYYQYALGNIIGIAVIVFIISVLQMLLLKNMLFYHLDLGSVLSGLAIYSLSISLLSLTIMAILKKGSDFQTAIPYLMIAIWIFGGWLYSETVVNSGMLQYLGRIPGMMVKDDIINQFINTGQHIRKESIMIEAGFQFVLFCFVYLIGKMRYDKNVN